MFAAIVSLLLLAAAVHGSLEPDFICPAGINRFAADASLGPDKYWLCERAGEPPILSTCPDGKYYHRRSGRCRSAKRPTLEERAARGGGRKAKAQPKDFDLLELENTEHGSKLLGQLYNARAGTFLPGMFLWSQHTTVKREMVAAPQLYSNMEVYQERDVEDRAAHLDLNGSLKLDLLAGVLSVSGTAQYLRDETEDSEKARVVMSFRSTRRSETMPVTTPVSNRFVCNFATRPNGPTHAITSRIIGLRAFLRFDLDVDSAQNREKIAGKLEASINLMPALSLSGSAWVDAEGKEVQNIENLSVRYYGDVSINNPTSYLAAVEAFNDIQAMANTTNAVVKYQLTPLSYLCTNNVKQVSEIQDGLVNTATQVLVELEKTRVATGILLNSNVAGLIPSVKRVINTFKVELDSYTDGIKENIQKELKNLRNGGAELKLLGIIQGYQDSAFAYDKARLFLEVRQREISTVQLAVDAVKGELFALSDSDNTDIEYIMSNKYCAFFVLRVLPETNAAEVFIEEQNVLDEGSMWYNNLTMVGSVGSRLKEFINFARANEDEEHGFIVRVRQAEEGVPPVNVKFYRPNVEDEEQEGDFQPPPTPPTPVCTPLFDGFDIATTPTYNEFVTRHYIIATSGEKEKVVERGNNGTEELLSIRGLKPNTAYNITTKFKVYEEEDFEGAGFSAPSPTVTCTTTLTSPVTSLNLTNLTPTSLSLSFEEPEQRAPGAHLTYQIRVLEEGQGEALHLQRSEAGEVEVGGLQEGMLYHVTVFTENDQGNQGTASEIEVVTPIDRLQSPEVLMVSSREIELAQRGLAHLPPQLSLEHLDVVIQQMDTVTREPIPDTLLNFTLPITQGKDELKFNISDLTPGETYGIQAQLYASFGDLSLVSTLTPILPIKTELNGSDEERAARRVDELKRAIAAQMALVREGLERDRALMASVDVDCTGERAEELLGLLEEGIERNITLMADIIQGAVGQVCIHPGMSYGPVNDPNPYDEHKIDSRATLTERECLTMCKQYTECEVATWKQPSYYDTPGYGWCGLYRNRRPRVWPRDNVIGVHRVCAEVLEADPERHRRCTQLGSYDLEDVGALTSLGFPRLFDCLMWCVNSACAGVTYSPAHGECTILERAMHLTADQNKLSVKMDCLRGVEM